MAKSEPDASETTNMATPDQNPNPAGETTTVPVESRDATPEINPLQAELQDLRDRNLRLIAEAQNAAKRAQREKQEALRYAEFDFARELLVVIDDFERTLESTKAKEELQPVAEGIRIIYDHFLKLLAQRGVKQIEAVGKPFDPTYHEALLQQPSAEHAAGTVIQELARGYTMHERILRPARVIVSSGPGAA
jgi:molecular chaperone GrpE